MLHGKPPVSARSMIKPRCLIRGDGSTGSFPDDFAELGKWFRQPGSQTRHEAASRDRETLRADTPALLHERKTNLGVASVLRGVVCSAL